MNYLYFAIAWLAVGLCMVDYKRLGEFRAEESKDADEKHRSNVAHAATGVFLVTWILWPLFQKK